MLNIDLKNFIKKHKLKSNQTLYLSFKTNGKTKFKVSDLIGLTMEEGKPQMPVNSTLFQINPDKNYEIEYEVLDS